MRKTLLCILVVLLFFSTGCEKEKEVDAINYINELDLKEPKLYKIMVNEYDKKENYLSTTTLIVDCTNTFCDYYTNKRNP